MIKPFVPDQIDGKPWQAYDTAAMANDLRFFNFVPGEKWHAFEGYAESQYFVDPCKLLLTTPGIDTATGSYSEFGIPATILANYLRENGIVPEKCDLNSILFLLTPAEDIAKMQHLVALIARFEQHIEQNSLLSEVLPAVYKTTSSATKTTPSASCARKCTTFTSATTLKNCKEMFRKSYFRAW